MMAVSSFRSQLRRDMNLRSGEILHVELQNETLSIRRPSKTLERIRTRLAEYIEPGSDVIGELKAQRVNDAQRS